MSQGIMASSSLSPGGGGDSVWCPHSTCPACRIRSTCRLATHLGGRVLDGQPPEKPQDERQGRARQKLLPDVSIQAATQRKTPQQAGEAEAARKPAVYSVSFKHDPPRCHNKPGRTVWLGWDTREGYSKQKPKAAVQGLCSS